MSIEPRVLDTLRRRIVDLREAASDYDKCAIDDIETKRRKADHLARDIYFLVNVSPKNIGLLKQAGLYEDFHLPDSSLIPVVGGVQDTFPPEILTAGVSSTDSGNNRLSPLVRLAPLRAPNKFRGIYLPRLLSIPHAPFIGLANWWNGLVGPDGEQISRRNICSIMRSNDGGVHLDSVLKDQSYLKLAGYDVGQVWVEEVGDDTAICVRGDDNEVSKFVMVAQVPPQGSVTPPSTSGPLPIVNGVSSIVRQIAGELDFGLRKIGV